MNEEDKQNYFKVGNYYISHVCYESYPCNHHVVEEGYVKPCIMTGLEIYKMLAEEGIMHEHFNSYKNYENGDFLPKKAFCENDYKKNDYRQIGKYYVSTFALQTYPPKHWVVYNNSGIEEKRLYLATDFLEILLHLFSFKTPILIGKNKKNCKINSRNFTYDGLTFSSSLFLLEDVKDEMWKHNGRSCFCIHN